MRESVSGRSWTSKVFNTVITLDTYQFVCKSTKNCGKPQENRFILSKFFAVHYLASSGCFKTVVWKNLSLVCIRTELEPKLITAFVEVQRLIYDIQT